MERMMVSCRLAGVAVLLLLLGCALGAAAKVRELINPFLPLQLWDYSLQGMPTLF